MKMQMVGFVGMSLLAAGSVSAQSWQAALSDSTGTPSAVTISPGDAFSFRFDLNMTGGATGNALDYYLAVYGNDDAGSGKFTLSQRNRSGSLFNDANSSDAAVIGALNPATTLNLGASTNPFQDLTGAQFIAEYTFTTAANLPAGAYTIAIDTNRSSAFWSVTDSEFESHQIMATYAVTVVPEPAAALGVAGVLAVALRRSRRK